MKTLALCLIMLGFGFLAGQFVESRKTATAVPAQVEVEMSHGAPVGDTSDPVVVLRRIIAGKFAAKDTELLSGTEPVKFKGQTWRMLKLRTENEAGAAIFADYFVRYEGDIPFQWVRLGDMQDYPGDSKEEMKAFIEAFMGAELMKL